MVRAVLDQPARHWDPAAGAWNDDAAGSACAHRGDAAGDRAARSDGATGERRSGEHRSADLRGAVSRSRALSAGDPRGIASAGSPTDTRRRWLMLTRFVRNQLIIFTIASIVGVAVMLFTYMQVPTLLGIGRINVTLQLPATGGLYQFSNVTYRGVQVGLLKDATITETGAEATLTLD